MPETLGVADRFGPHICIPPPRGQRNQLLRQALLGKLPCLLRERELPCRKWQKYDKAFACVRALLPCAAAPAAPPVPASSCSRLQPAAECPCVAV